MSSDPWPKIAVLGAGAVGCYFGGMLARAGAPVTLIGRPAHVEAINQDRLLLESRQFQQRIPVAANTDPAAVRGANIVLFCVKTLDTEAAAQSLAPHLAADAIVISLQNGVDNVERIRSVLNADVIPAVVYVGAEMTAPGCVKHTARGDLVLGDLPPQQAPARQSQLESLAAVFAHAGVPCRLSDNVEGELWMKLLINCAYNAISALSRARYGRITANPWTRDLIMQIVTEVLAVAQAANIRLPDPDPTATALKLADHMTCTLSSTAQDIARGKRTEIDALNGHIARRGKELGVAAPVNQTLHALVKLLEETG